ncbi:MAG: RDD family protein [Xanthobacteraceae bacterium]
MAANSGSTDSSAAIKPHAFDPVTNPELFNGVLSRRVVAFVIDVIVIAAPVVAAAILIVVFGIITLGLGLILLWPLHAAAIVWAILYYGFTLGGSASATVGMRVMDLQMRTWYGAPAYFVLGAVHAIAFWISVTMLSPLVLLVGLFTRRKQLLHDLLLGTVVINSPVRAAIMARHG